MAKENGYVLPKDDLQIVLNAIMNQIAEDQQAGVVATLEEYRDHSDIRRYAPCWTVCNHILTISTSTSMSTFPLIMAQTGHIFSSRMASVFRTSISVTSCAVIFK